MSVRTYVLALVAALLWALVLMGLVTAYGLVGLVVAIIGTLVLVTWITFWAIPDSPESVP